MLLAASRVFARKGYWEATNADICREAEVNTASVSYHFGGKDNLYAEAWKCSFQKSLERHPPDGGAAADASAEERLHARILSFMQHVSDPESYDIDILQREMGNPTGLVTQVNEEAMRVIEQGFRSLAQELLGPGASKKQVDLCQMSIMTQCMDPMLRARLIDGAVGPGEAVPPFGIEELADHITRFSLAGIRSIRESGAEVERARKRRRPSRTRRNT